MTLVAVAGIGILCALLTLAGLAVNGAVPPWLPATALICLAAAILGRKARY